MLFFFSFLLHSFVILYSSILFSISNRQIVGRLLFFACAIRRGSNQYVYCFIFFTGFVSFATSLRRLKCDAIHCCTHANLLGTSFSWHWLRCNAIMCCATFLSNWWRFQEKRIFKIKIHTVHDDEVNLLFEHILQIINIHNNSHVSSSNETESRQVDKIRSKRGKVPRSSDFKIKNDVKQHLEAVDTDSMPLDIQTNFLSESVRKYLELGRAIPGWVKLFIYKRVQKQAHIYTFSAVAPTSVYRISHSE